MSPANAAHAAAQNSPSAVQEVPANLNSSSPPRQTLAGRTLARANPLVQPCLVSQPPFLFAFSFTSTSLTNPQRESALSEQSLRHSGTYCNQCFRSAMGMKHKGDIW